MIQVSFNGEILWLTDDGWHNLKDLLREGDKIEILGVEDDQTRKDRFATRPSTTLPYQ